MKYIRTEDGKIFDSFALKVEEIAYKDEQGEWCKEWRTINPLKKASKIADTIEELCDEFVVIVPTEKPDLVVDFAKNRQTFVKAKLDVYGAIWTDKGLQFVARMNSEGGLELL